MALRSTVAAGALVVAATGLTACGASSASSGTGGVATSATSPSTLPKLAKATSAEADRYLTDLSEADPALASYADKDGTVAVRALLTDGSAFCSFLQTGGGIDNAMVSVAIGARADEARTHLPLSVTTFNTVEAVALLTLCPSYEAAIPARDREKIRALGATLGAGGV